MGSFGGCLSSCLIVMQHYIMLVFSYIFSRPYVSDFTDLFLMLSSCWLGFQAVNTELFECLIHSDWSCCHCLSKTYWVFFLPSVITHHLCGFCSEWFSFMSLNQACNYIISSLYIMKNDGDEMVWRWWFTFPPLKVCGLKTLMTFLKVITGEASFEWITRDYAANWFLHGSQTLT